MAWKPPFRYLGFTHTFRAYTFDNAVDWRNLTVLLFCQRNHEYEYTRKKRKEYTGICDNECCYTDFSVSIPLFVRYLLRLGENAYLLAEIVIVVSEAVVYFLLFTPKHKVKFIIYAIIANLSSFLSGEVLWLVFDYPVIFR